MKLEKLIGERFRERPADCVIDSHALMVKGGYMKYMANGIYSSYLPLKRITRKIEQILREEMDKLDGQEVSFPVVMPAALWEEVFPMNLCFLRRLERILSYCVMNVISAQIKFG